MEPEVLLANLRALVERMPNFSDYSATSREHQTWLAQVCSLVSRWDHIEGIQASVASRNLSNPLMREPNLETIVGAMYRAIADLEFQLPEESRGVFAAGEVYDFFRELNKVIGSAEATLFIVDPYLDTSVFDHYLVSRQDKVTVRLLTWQYADSLVAAKDAYNTQHGNVLELRKFKDIHDRVIFVDGQVCWVCGQSLKDAAKAKPTYLAPLAPDVAPGKLHEYERLWSQSEPI